MSHVWGRSAHVMSHQVLACMGTVIVAVLATAACSGGVVVDSEVAPATPVRPTETPTSPPTPAIVSESAGLIATAGDEGLIIRSAAGMVVAELATGDVVLQPTWSRDGRRLVALQADPAGGASVLRFDPMAASGGSDGGEAELVSARRPYFFYSWNSAGTHIAALGGGPRGTSLDILDDTGEVTSTTPFDAGSLFVSWEPDGDDLLLNADGQVWLVPDMDPAFAKSLGPAGVNFQAPLWLTGRSALFVSAEFGLTPVVARLDVDTGETENLGPATSTTVIAVSPDRASAFLAHAPPEDTITAAFAGQADQEITATLEVLDLETGQRSAVGSDPAFWIEWSPDGSSVLVGSRFGEALGWNLWREGELSKVTEFLPSAAFFQNYIRFAPAYIETPRLWAPDSSAFTYAATVDGVDTAFVASVESGAAPVALGDGSVAFWSPVGPGS